MNENVNVGMCMPEVYQREKIIGKPVVYFREAEPILQDPNKTKKLLELELTLCEERNIIGYGGISI